MRLYYLPTDGDFVTWLKAQFTVVSTIGNTTLLSKAVPGAVPPRSIRLFVHVTTNPSVRFGNSNAGSGYAWLGWAKANETLVQEATVGWPGSDPVPASTAMVRLEQPGAGFTQKCHVLLDTTVNKGGIHIIDCDATSYAKWTAHGWVASYATEGDFYGAVYPGTGATQTPRSYHAPTGSFSSTTVTAASLVDPSGAIVHQPSGIYARGIYGVPDVNPASFPDDEYSNSFGVLARPFIWRWLKSPANRSPFALAANGVYYTGAAIDSALLPDGSMLIAPSAGIPTSGGFVTTIPA